MADAPTRLSGVVRARIADHGGTEFTYRVQRDGRRVRCSALDGAVHVIAGTGTVWCRRDGSDVLDIEPADPHLLHAPDDYEFGVRLFDWSRWKGNDFTEPVDGPEEVLMLGRPAWRITLAPPPHKPEPMQIVVDQQTFLTLHEGNEAFGTYHRWSELDLDPHIDESVFAWNDTDRVASEYQ
ncbi:hypothetical protein [uncultured Jatrophihabitans sp.]|uniref:hypothetical protein n=1 Tax=uncultured Jatrophihabitans sp. TaxID=1610747 RepID=UPI0035CA3AE6